MKTTDDAFSRLLEKYPEAKHPPKLDCRFCHGSGERYISKKSAITGKPIGDTTCICVFMDHGVSDDAGLMLGAFSRKKLREKMKPGEFKFKIGEKVRFRGLLGQEKTYRIIEAKKDSSESGNVYKISPHPEVGDPENFWDESWFEKAEDEHEN